MEVVIVSWTRWNGLYPPLSTGCKWDRCSGSRRVSKIEGTVTRLLSRYRKTSPKFSQWGEWRLTRETQIAVDISAGKISTLEGLWDKIALEMQPMQDPLGVPSTHLCTAGWEEPCWKTLTSLFLAPYLQNTHHQSLFNTATKGTQERTHGALIKESWFSQKTKSC